MRKMMILSCLAAFLLYSCNGKEGDAGSDREKVSYEQTKKTLLEKEQANPAMFLSVTGKKKNNVIGQTVVKGKISNNATLAIYKDVKIRLEFFSKTQTHLETDEEVIFIELRPGRSEDFKTKYFAPKGTDSVALTVIDAKTVPL